MFDILQIILRTLTYALIIGFGLRYRKMPVVFMPLLAGTLNFAWEINSLIYQWAISQKLNFGCLVWTVLDIVIYIQNVRYLIISKKKNIRIVLYLLLLPGFIALFYMMFRLPGFNGQLIIAFVIDCIMAVEFLACVKKISSHGRIPIAITKLFGDLFAWFYYMKFSNFVVFIGVVVFLLNLLYLAFCLEENAALSKKKSRRGR